ncbi:MAG: NADH-quinone oxidoreductase subunit N [Chloroflexi bacterium]|nr:MAG: NADH-quinone oxidoreductase subunit N [Chloroflexota bacterium]
MTASDLVALLPWLVLAAGALVVMLAIAFRRDHRLAAGVAMATLGLALLALPVAATAAPRAVTPLFHVDGYALFYTALLVAATAAVALLSYGYLRGHPETQEEYYVLLLLAVLGSSLLAASSHLVSFFLALELLSVSLYTLIGYLRQRRLCLEAAIKYLVLSGVSTAFMLFGMALLYAGQGTLAFEELVGGTSIAQGTWTVPLLAGMALVAVALGFKLSLVPFHFWSPDVYEGAPAPVAALVATVSKGGVLALVLRLFSTLDGVLQSPLVPALGLVAAASMLAGSLLALRQENVKRVLAYSSIAHLGYLLVPLLAGGELATAAATFYLVAYVIAILAALGVVTVLSTPEGDAGTLEGYRGLFWRRPWLGGLLAASLFSLAGLPLTAGFLAKLYLVAAGVGAASPDGQSRGLWWLVGALVLSSAIALYYYLRIVVVMLQQPTEPEAVGAGRPLVPLGAGLVLALLALGLLWLGVYPSPLLRAIQGAIAGIL